MKLEVGMYVRTKDGHIDKIIKIDNKALNGRTIQVEKGELDCCMGYEDFTDLFNSSHYEKASFNIIEILEVGDIISFYEDIDNYKKQYVIGIPDLITLDEIKDKITNDNIRLVSILTKEQMEQLAYKVEE